jgi:hypothetical protein
MAVIEAIATTYLEADAASVTFSSIPATYEHLQLRISAKQDYASTTTASYGMIQLNGDTGANYSDHRMYGKSSTVAGTAGTGQTVWYLGRYANLTPAANFSGTIWDILDYANTNKNTTCMLVSGVGLDPAWVEFSSGLWDDTAAVHTILIDRSGGSNWMRGSEFTLYGLNSA